MLRFKQIMICMAIGITAAGITSAQTIQINRENKTIAISTTDEATATADIASITIGFEVFGPDAQTVTADGGKLSQAIMDALHKIGVEDKSIESSNQGLERNTNFADSDKADQRARKQFIIRQSWEVSVSPQSAAEAIRVAIAAGANTSGAIDWRLADRKALQAKAAGNALVKAREVAARMADGLHVKLSALIYASNETPNTRFYIPHGLQTVTVNAETASISNVIVIPALEIRPQTVREEATVYAVFSIE
jgi:uncharacterized protein YggE